MPETKIKKKVAGETPPRGATGNGVGQPTTAKFLEQRRCY